MTRRPPTRRWLAALCAVALAFAGAVALPVAAADASPIVNANISGLVTDLASFTAGDTVDLYQYPSGGTTTGPLTSTTMNADGTFSFVTTIDSDNYYAILVETTASGFEPTFSNDTITAPVDGSSTGVLQGDASMDFGAITMNVNTTVSGVITPTDATLDGTTVTLTQYDADGFGDDVGNGVVSTVTFGGSTITAFVFSADVAPGKNYVLLIDPSTSSSTGYTEGFTTGTVVPPDVGAAGTLNGAAGTMDFGLVTVPTLHLLTGYVTSGGVPVNHAEVDVVPVGYPGPITSVFTNSAGYYEADPSFLIPSGLPLFLAVEKNGYAGQFYSDASGPGPATQIVASGAPGSTITGFDFHLIPLSQRINILASVFPPITGCTCGGLPHTVTHLYMKSGAYWVPVETQNDFGTTAVGFVESNPGDYRLRFTDEAGNWLAVDQSGSSLDPSFPTEQYTPDSCAIDLPGLVLGDQPEPFVSLEPLPSSCGDEPEPPAPITPAIVHRTTHFSTPTPDVTDTPTPTPTPTVTQSPSPEPSVTTQTIPPVEKNSPANLAWLWWVLGVVLLLALIGAGLVIFRRRP